MGGLCASDPLGISNALTLSNLIILFGLSVAAPICKSPVGLVIFCAITFPVAVSVPPIDTFDVAFILLKLPVEPCTFATNQLESKFPVKLPNVPVILPVKLAVTFPPEVLRFPVKFEA